MVDAEEWILKLIDFISWSRYVNTDIRIIGICFGHQLLAACLGGRCQTDVKCWEIGVSSVVLTDSGKALLRNPESESTDALVRMAPTLHVIDFLNFLLQSEFTSFMASR